MSRCATVVRQYSMTKQTKTPPNQQPLMGAGCHGMHPQTLACCMVAAERQARAGRCPYISLSVLPPPSPAVDNVAAVHGRAGQHHWLIRQGQHVVQAADCSIQVLWQQRGSRCGDGPPPRTPRWQQRCGSLAGSAAAAGCWSAGEVLHHAHGAFNRHAAQGQQQARRG